MNLFVGDVIKIVWLLSGICIAHETDFTCPIGASTGKRVCYILYNNEKQTWQDSRNFCKIRGGDLLSIRYTEVFNDIYAKINDHGYSLWIGASDISSEGNFIWVDGSSCCSSCTWVRDEPNGGKSENCVNFWNSGHGIGINDYSCSNKLIFICEFKECPVISQCATRHCTNINDVVCDKCVDDNIFYKRVSNNKQCKRMCSFDTHTCWPGTCTDGLTEGCTCSSGFRKVINSTHTVCQLDVDKTPTINTCQTRVDGGESKQTMAGKCRELKDFYGNFQPRSLSFTMQADFKIDITWQSAWKHIEEQNFGVTDASVFLKRIVVSGQSELLDTIALKTDSNHSVNTSSTFHDTVTNYTLEQPKFKLANGERLCIVYEALGGGYMQPKDFTKNEALHPVPYDKKVARETVCYRYDDERPRHCLVDHTCNDIITEPLQTATRITRNGIIPISCKGWKDPIPKGGNETHASGLESFQVTIYEVSGGLLAQKVQDIKMNTPHTSFTLNLTAPGPRLYCIQLEVKDVADNVQQARRFVLYDNTTIISSHADKPLIITSASVESDHRWQTHHNDICLYWKDHFINEFYLNNNLLQPIKPDKHGFISGIYEQKDGLLPVNGTPNIHGVTQFKFSWSRNGGSFSAQEQVPDFLNQSYCKSIHLSDGETYTLNLEAVDIVSNTLSENTTIHIDRTAPHIDKIGLVKNGIRRLFVHDETDLSKMDLQFEVLDPHSGIENIMWSFGTSVSGAELGTGFIGVRTIQQASRCPPHTSSCYCPDVGDCELSNHSIPLNKLVDNNTHTGMHNRNYYFTIKATNKARLFNIEHVDILVDDSPPEYGVIYEGAVGSKDMDYTTEDNFMVRWHGFIDHESGIREYRLGLSEMCLTKRQLLNNSDGNITEYKVLPYTEFSVRLRANFTGKRYVSIIAINNALEESDAVCSDGITRDITIPAIKDLNLEHGRWSESIYCKDAEAWLLQSDLKKHKLMTTEACKQRCMNEAMNYDLFNALPARYAVHNDTEIADFLCTKLPLYDSTTIIFVPNDRIYLSWDVEALDSQIENFAIGLDTSLENTSTDTSIEFSSTNRKSSYSKMHAGFGTGELFYAYIKVLSKSGLEQITCLGPIMIDESPPAVHEKPRVLVDNDYVRIGWNKEDFEDIEQSAPINQVFFQIFHDGEKATPLLEWRSQDAETCKGFSGGCFKYPTFKLQHMDTDLGLDFVVNLYVYNNAGHFTEVATDIFHIPSKYPPGQAIVKDVDPYTIRTSSFQDVNVHFTSQTLCGQWDGFKHHENITIEIGVGTSKSTDDIVAFQTTTDTSVTCINSSKIQNNIHYFVIIKASCSGGNTVSSSNGVTIVAESDMVAATDVTVEPIGDKSPQFTIHPLNNSDSEICFVSSLHIGVPYMLFLSQSLPSFRLSSKSLALKQNTETDNMFEILPFVEHPCLTINDSVFSSTAVKVTITNHSVLSTLTKELMISWSNVVPSLNTSGLYFNIVLLGKVVDKNSSKFVPVTNIERANGKVHLLRNISLRPAMVYMISLQPCNSVRCLQSLHSSELQTEKSIQMDGVRSVYIDLDRTKTCSDIRFTWKKASAISNITMYQWTISKDAEANVVLIQWRSVVETEKGEKEVHECVDLPVHGQSTMYVCVRAYSRSGNTKTICKEATHRLLSNVPTDTVYDMDATSAYWSQVLEIMHSSNIGNRYTLLNDMEMDFGTASTTVAGILVYATERNVTWFLMKSRTLPFMDMCERDTDCFYSVTTTTGFAVIPKERITPGTFYYICAYSNVTNVKREFFTETLDEIRSCGNGFVLDNVPPTPGSVTVINRNGFLTSLENIHITWSGFDDNIRAETLGYIHRIKQYAVAIGTIFGGEDIANFSAVGITNKMVYPLLFTADGSEIFVSVKATDHAGLATIVTSKPLIVDTTAPEQGRASVDGDELLPYITSKSINIILDGFTDAQSGINHYSVSLGTINDTDDVVAQTTYYSDNVHIDLPDNLIDGHKYFLTAKAVNRAGLVSLPFTVDFIVDRSTPTGGHVLDGHWSNKDVDVQTELGYIQGHWRGFTDPHSGISYYRVGLGTGTLMDDVENMVDVGLQTDFSWNGTLHLGKTYYITVEACNGGGLCRTLSSDGVMLDNSPPIHGEVRVGSAEKHQKYLPHGSSVHIQWAGFEDPQSGIDHYETCLGHQPHSCDVQAFTSSLLESSIIKTHLNLHSGTKYYASVKAVNRGGLSVVLTSDAFQVDDTPPVIKLKPSFILDTGGNGVQWDKSVLKMSWKFEDYESRIASHIVTLKTHHDGHTPLEYFHTGNIDNITINFDESNLLNDGDEYYVVVTSCNHAGICSSEQSQSLLIDSTPPHLGGFKPPLEWKNILSDQNKTEAEVQLTWYGFIDAESSVQNYFITLSKTYYEDELSNGVITVAAENNKTDQSIRISLNEAIKQDDVIILSLWANNRAGLNTSIARVSVNALLGVKGTHSNSSGIFEIQKHSCDIHFCNKDCTCAILGQPCKSDHNCSQNDINVENTRLPSVHVYGGLMGNEYNITASSACLAGHWFAAGDETMIKRYEWSMSLKGQEPGVGIFDLSTERPWKDVGKRKQAVYCLQTNQALTHELSYLIHVKVWYSFDMFKIFFSPEIKVDHSPPAQRKGKNIKDSDVSCKQDFDFIDWMDTISACWDDVFMETQGEIVHYTVSLGTTVNGSDIYPRSDVGTGTRKTLSGLNLSHGTRYYFTVTAFNNVGLHTSLTSDGFVIDMEKPVAGVVFNSDHHTDSAYQYSPDRFSISWHGFVDQYSGVASYHVAVVESSTTSYDNVSFTDVHLQTRYIFENMDLKHGFSYVGLVKAVDAAGHESIVARSGAKMIDITPPSGIECLDFDYVHSVSLLGARYVSFYANVTKDVYYFIKGSFLHPINVREIRPYLEIDRSTYRLYLTVSHNGTASFEHTLLSPVSGFTHFNISLNVIKQSQTIPSSNVVINMSRCSSTRPTNDTKKALIVTQTGPSRLTVGLMIFDIESAVKQIQLGAGTTPGGFQIKPLSHVHKVAYKVLEVNLEHGSSVYVTAIADNHSGERSIFHAEPVTIDKTPPDITISAVTLHQSDPVENVTGRQITVIARWKAVDDESGVTYCLCSLGHMKRSYDVEPIRMADTIHNCDFKNLTLNHGDSVYVNVKCINSIELSNEVTSERNVVRIERPDASGATVRVVGYFETVHAPNTHVASYVLMDKSTIQLEWSDFKDVSGIDHYEYRLLSDNKTVLDWTGAGDYTSVAVKGIDLKFGKFYSAQVRANNSLYTSQPVTAELVLYNTEPGLTGKPMSTERRGNTIYIDWSDVFSLIGGLDVFYDVQVGTRRGFSDVIELQRIGVTSHVIILPQSTILTPNISEVFISVTCTYITGLFTEYVADFKLLK